MGMNKDGINCRPRAAHYRKCHATHYGILVIRVPLLVKRLASHSNCWPYTMACYWMREDAVPLISGKLVNGVDLFPSSQACACHCFHSWQPVSDHLLSARLTHRHGCILHATGLSHTETWSSCAARWLQWWDIRVERWIQTHPWQIWLTTILHGSSLFVHNLSINVSAEAYSSLCMEVTSKETELLVNAGCSQCVGCIDDLNVQQIQIIVAKARFAFVTPPKTPLWRGPSEWPMLKHEYAVSVSTKLQTAAASHPEDDSSEDVIQLEWSTFCMAVHLVQMKSNKRDTSMMVTCLISSRPKPRQKTTNQNLISKSNFFISMPVQTRYYCG